MNLLLLALLSLWDVEGGAAVGLKDGDALEELFPQHLLLRCHDAPAAAHWRHTGSEAYGAVHFSSACPAWLKTAHRGCTTSIF